MNNNIGTANVSKSVSTSAQGLYAVILAGGIGSRFWPLSRSSYPKQFLTCLPAGRRFLQRSTLIQGTARRILRLIPLENIYVVGNKTHSSEITRQLSRFKLKKENILLEPQSKNTAPAIGLAAVRILSQDPDAVMIILPSDHLISKEDEFLNTLRRAKEVALSGYLVTLGIPPKSPETGYGYIKIKSKLKSQKSKIIYYEVEKFCEKPTLKKAKEFIKDKKYYWNSGIFIWKANVILEEIKKYLPDLYRNLRENKETSDIQKIWQDISPVSIDYGVMEKTKRAVMIPARFGWRDLGNWRALDELLPKDNLGNIFKARSVDFGSKNITVFGNKRLIATVGLNNIIIVDTPDAILICHKNHVQDVKRIVKELKKRGHGRQE